MIKSEWSCSLLIMLFWKSLSKFCIADLARAARSSRYCRCSSSSSLCYRNFYCNCRFREGFTIGKISFVKIPYFFLICACPFKSRIWSIYIRWSTKKNFSFLCFFLATQSHPPSTLRLIYSSSNIWPCDKNSYAILLSLFIYWWPISLLKISCD